MNRARAAYGARGRQRRRHLMENSFVRVGDLPYTGSVNEHLREAARRQPRLKEN